MISHQEFNTICTLSTSKQASMLLSFICSLFSLSSGLLPPPFKSKTHSGLCVVNALAIGTVHMVTDVWATEDPVDYEGSIGPL